MPIRAQAEDERTDRRRDGGRITLSLAAVRGPCAGLTLRYPGYAWGRAPLQAPSV
jgi:hypothetical protein